MSHHTKSKVEPPTASPAAVVDPATADLPAKADAAHVAAADAASVPKAEVPEVAQLRDRLLRLQADFDNFRKRTLRERETWHARAVESVLLALLPALDNLNLGLRHAVEQQVDEAHIKGLRLVADELQAVLRKFSVTPIETAGQPFDVRWHEALAYLPSTEVAAESVIQETRAGYRIGEAMLRPAQVLVSSGPPPDAAVKPAPDHAPNHAHKPAAPKSEG